jgi:hypothetical protein
MTTATTERSRTKKAPAESKVIRLYKFQSRAIRSRARYTALCAGTGVGKTWFGPIWLAELIRRTSGTEGTSQTHGDRYMVIGPTADMARDILAPAIVSHYAGTDLEGHYHIQRATYELPNGALIPIRSADRPLRIEGHHLKGVWLDEPSQMKAMIWTVVQSRVGYYEAPALLTGYPTDMGWYYHDFYKRWERGDPDYNVIQVPSLANPNYPRAEYRRAKRTQPPWLFDMRYRGIFRKPMGLVYPTFGGDSMFVDPFPIPDDWPTYVGIDPGVFFGALFWTWHDGTFYVFAERYTEVVQPASVHAPALRALLQGTPVAWIYDPARATDAAELEAQGIGPLAKADNDVLTGIATLTGLINGGRFKVFRGAVPNFVDQMEKYSFPTDTSTGLVAKEKPIKKYDHLPDCARYIAQTLVGAREEIEEEVVIYDDDQIISPY